MALFSWKGIAQNLIIKGSIVNKDTHKPIPYASVKLIKEDISSSCDENGIFKILSKFSLDTLLVTAIGYFPHRVLTEKINNSIIALHEKKNFLEEVRITSKKNSVTLNPLEKSSIGGYRVYGGSYVQIARQFNNPQANSSLEEVKIARWIHFDSKFINTRAKFRLRIYDQDTVTKKPANDLYNGIIEVFDGKLTPIITVNLKEFKIHIPNKAFFIGIEWILSSENEFFDMSAKLRPIKLDSEGKVVYESVLRYQIDYQPLIQSSIKRANSNVLTYRLYFNGQWILEDHRQGADPAISVKIAYFN